MLFPNKRKYNGIGQIELKNIGISDIGKNPISCIPTDLVSVSVNFVRSVRSFSFLEPVQIPAAAPLQFAKDHVNKPEDYLRKV